MTKHIILFDPEAAREGLLPITFTRPVAMVRWGISTMLEKWQALLPGCYSVATQPYLSAKYPAVVAEDDSLNLYVAANVHPDAELVKAVDALAHGEALIDAEGVLIARRGTETAKTRRMYQAPVLAVNGVTDLFMLNGEALRRDYARITAGRKSQPLSETCTLIGDPANLFIEEGATVEGCVINVKGGPVYVGPDAEIMECASLRGPVALCEHAVVNMGGKIYGATTLGPFCKVGGELNNVVMTGYSNKAHDGFIGNAVIGEWCNLGAGCTASNLKNTYSPVRLWSYAKSGFVKTNLQFCGLIMGDHSKAGINTMFNTATTVGVGVNFYGAGFPRTFIPSFSEGTTAGMKEVELSRVFETASIVMARRGLELTQLDKDILTYIRENISNR